MTTDKLLPIDHVTDGVYISGHRATQYADAMREAGITNILKLYADSPHFPPDFNIFENALEDGELIPEQALRDGIDFIHEQVNAENPVLVMCGAGISRSSTFVLAYLLEKGYELPDAYRLLRQQHPEAHPHPQMWESLIVHFGLNYSIDDILNWLFEE